MFAAMTLVALYVGLAHSWDIAVGVGTQLIFYTDGTKTNVVNFTSRNVTALAYDEVHNIMLYVDKQNNNDSIFSFNLHSKENKCLLEKNGRNIHSIAYDLATQALFFTDTNDNSINWISLKPESVNNVYGNILIKMDDRTPRNIAVDSCKGYIYWINTNNYLGCKDCMERARLDGSEREIINKRYKWLEVLSLVVDPVTRKIYYIDGFNVGHSYDNMYFNRADLNGQHEETLYRCENQDYSASKELTVSKNYFYWVNHTDGQNTVWQIARNANRPQKIIAFDTEKPLALATNYKIENQVLGLLNCEALSSLIPTIIHHQSEYTSFRYPTLADLLSNWRKPTVTVTDVE